MAFERSRLLLLLPALAATILIAPAPGEAKRGRAPEVRGIVTARPEGRAGEWVVAGQSFVASERTELDTREGPLAVGACAKVRYAEVEGRAVALEIDSEPASDCSGSRVPAGTR
jgi:hypothetical protein